MSKSARKIAVLVLVLITLSLASHGLAEPLKVNNPGTGSVPLQGNWQLHCNFGQQDDITVFRVTRLAESAPANAARLSLATQIAGA